MDPITTAIVAALAGLSNTVVKDAYEGLKAMIVRKFGNESDLAKAVEHLEKKPDSPGRAQMVTEEMAAAKGEGDGELLAAARLLLEKIQSQPDGQARIQQTVTGNQNIFSATGDITINRQ
jgi:Het-E N-terminal domain